MPNSSNATPQLQTSETPLDSSSASNNSISNESEIVNSDGLTPEETSAIIKEGTVSENVEEQTTSDDEFPESITYNGVELTLSETKDTRDDSPLYVLKPTKRISEEEFNGIRDAVKAHGGFCSRFLKQFAFKEKDKYIDFINSAEEIAENKNEPKSETAEKVEETSITPKAENAVEDAVEDKKEEAEPEDTPEGFYRGKDGLLRFKQMDIDYSNSNMRKGTFRIHARVGEPKTVEGMVCGKFGIHKNDAERYSFTHLQSGLLSGMFNKLTEAKKYVEYVNEKITFSDVTYARLLSGGIRSI